MKLMRTIRYAWQRLTRGWDDSELWNLDETIAKFVLPRLRRFRTYTHTRPHDLTPEDWDNVLGEIQWFLEQHVEPWDKDLAYYHERERYERAGALFGKYFGALWD